MAQLTATQAGGPELLPQHAFNPSARGSRNVPGACWPANLVGLACSRSRKTAGIDLQQQCALLWCFD